jgi:hypothetical protein
MVTGSIRAGHIPLREDSRLPGTRRLALDVLFRPDIVNLLARFTVTRNDFRQ